MAEISTYFGHSSLSQAQNFPTWSLSHLHFPHSQSPLLLQISPESGFCMHFFVCSPIVLTPMSHSHCLPENPDLRKINKMFLKLEFLSHPLVRLFIFIQTVKNKFWGRIVYWFVSGGFSDLYIRTIIFTIGTQCARTDLNKRFLPKPMTTKGWKGTP